MNDKEDILKELQRILNDGPAIELSQGYYYISEKSINDIISYIKKGENDE